MDLSWRQAGPHGFDQAQPVRVELGLTDKARLDESRESSASSNSVTGTNMARVSRSASSENAAQGATKYLTPEDLQEQNLPPLTLCGGPVGPYQLNGHRDDPGAKVSGHVRQTMTSKATTSPHLADASKRYRETEERVEIGRDDKPPLQGTYDPAPPYRSGDAGPAEELAAVGPSPELVKMLRDATPEQRQEALRIAAKLLGAMARGTHKN